MQTREERFKIAAEFVLILSPLLLLCNRTGGKKSYLDIVTTDILKNAMSPDKGFAIEYRNVFVSKGNLPRGELAYSKASMDSIHFIWNDNSAGNRERKRDRAVLVAYCEKLNKCAFTTWGARRRDEEATLEVPQFYGNEVQTWLSFMSADGRFIATSVYAGSVTLSNFH